MTLASRQDGDGNTRLANIYASCIIGGHRPDGDFGEYGFDRTADGRFTTFEGALARGGALSSSPPKASKFSKCVAPRLKVVVQFDRVVRPIPIPIVLE